MGQNADTIRAEADGLRVSADNLDIVADDVQVLEDGPPAAPTFVSVELSATEVEAGQSVTVLWEAQDADSVAVEAQEGPVFRDLGSHDASGSVSDTPEADTDYVLTAVGPGGETVATVSVTVVQPRPAPTVDSLTLSPSEVEAGQEVEVAWQTTEADTIRIEFVGSVVEDLASGPVDGSLIHAPSESGTYRVTVTNPEGTDSAEAAVTVTQPEGDVDLVIADQVISGHMVPAGEVHEIRGTVESDANVVVLGTLRMRPGATLRFVDVDESAYQGGGMDVLSTDVGLWVTGEGRLDLQGTARTGWTRMQAPPVGWQPDDRILICPNGPGETSPSDFRVVPFADADPPDPVTLPDGSLLQTECANLTRDVIIEGTPGGRAHVFVRSEPSEPHVVKHVAFRHLGPTGVMGRYPLHFHRNGDSSRGSVVEGCVSEHGGNHAFVPHDSHGIEMVDCVAYETMGKAYWYDKGDITRDLLWDRCLAAVVHSEGRGFRLSAFMLGANTGNVIRNCAAVGVQGRKDASGFEWPDGLGKGTGTNFPRVWGFQGNVAHNNRVHGTFVWQNNSDNDHPVDDTIVYHCGAAGFDHGAYQNAYQYRGFQIVGCKTGIIWHAQSQSAGYTQRFTDGIIADCDVGILAAEHAVPSDASLFRDITFENVGVKLRVSSGKERTVGDFVRCGIEPDDVDVVAMTAGSRLRFQRADGTAWQMDAGGNVTEIDPFWEN